MSRLFAHQVCHVQHRCDRLASKTPSTCWIVCRYSKTCVHWALRIAATSRTHHSTRQRRCMRWSSMLDDLKMPSSRPTSTLLRRSHCFFPRMPADRGTDKRPLTQSCVSPFATKVCKWQESEAHQSGILQGLPLVKVSDMEGYDPENGQRPGAAARLEQNLG